ncbi:MAG: LysR family transcriptional regulator [Burkholderiaceae bacterium]|nr:LysR family transcriptional regulator [Burkholderiaceae bacterium]
METATLRLFLAIAEQGSLTKAAAALETSQSAISRQIVQLEAECGGKLFHRTGRGMVLSDLGSILLPRVEKLLGEIDGILGEAQAMAGIPAGEIKLGLLPIVASVIASRLFKEVQARFPNVRMSLFEGYSGQLEEWLDSGKLDLAVLFHYGKGVPRNQDLLAEVDACLIGTHGDRLTLEKTVRFEQLHDIPLALPSAPNPLRSVLEHTARKCQIRLNPVIEANSIPVQLELVATGGCYTIIPYFAVAKKVQEGILQASLIGDPSIDRSLTLAMTTQRPISLAAREVGRLVRQIVEELRDTDVWGLADVLIKRKKT